MGRKVRVGSLTGSFIGFIFTYSNGMLASLLVNSVTSERTRKDPGVVVEMTANVPTTILSGEYFLVPHSCIS